MYQMVYISKASQEILTDSDHHISNILKTATKNNSSNSITGLLIYNSGIFLQLLEGEEESVTNIFNKISKDDRHSDLKVILRQDTESRLFEDWAMASCNLDLVSDQDFLKNTNSKDILQSCLDGDTVDELRILDLLEAFRISFN